MPKKSFWTFALALLAFCFVVLFASNQDVHSQRPAPRAEELQKRRDIETELQSIAIVERKLMIPMRDGTRIPAWPAPSRAGAGPAPGDM